MFWINSFFSNGHNHRKAAEEVVIISLIAIFPLFLLPVIASLKGSAEDPIEWSKVLYSAVSSGQLYLYSFSTFGTIIWLCVEDVSDKPFPPRKWFLTSAVLSGFICLLVYSADTSLAKPINATLVKWSVVIYLCYLLMYYVLLVFKGVRAPDIAVSLNDGASRLMDESRKQRGVQ